MAWLLEFEQEERRSIVGIIENRRDAETFLAGIPFVRKSEDGEYDSICFEEIPELYTASYKNWRYVFSRSSWKPEEMGGEIEVSLTEVSRLDETCAEGTYVRGYTVVDGYSYPNEDVFEAVEKREKLFAEAKAYYESRGKEVARGALGSEDGEYVLISGEIAFHLDPETIEEWEKAGSFENWISRPPV